MARQIWPLGSALAGDMADLRASSMRSLVQVLTLTSGPPDTYGRAVDTWTDPDQTDPVRAGARATATRSSLGEVPLWDWEIYLPLETAVNARDRIYLIHSNGAQLGQLLAVVGLPEPGPTAIRVKCKLVTEE